MSSGQIMSRPQALKHCPAPRDPKEWVHSRTWCKHGNQLGARHCLVNIHVSATCLYPALPWLSCHQDSRWPPSLVMYPLHGYATWTTTTALGCLRATALCGHDLKPVGWKWLKFWVLQLISVVLRFPLLPSFHFFTAGKRNFIFCLSMVGHCLWLFALP